MLLKNLAKKVGQEDLILIERNENAKSIGKDQNFFNAFFNEEIKQGDIVPCVYIGVDNNMLIAKRI